MSPNPLRLIMHVGEEMMEMDAQGFRFHDDKLAE